MIPLQFNTNWILLWSWTITQDLHGQSSTLWSSSAYSISGMQFKDNTFTDIDSSLLPVSLPKDAICTFFWWMRGLSCLWLWPRGMSWFLCCLWGVCRVKQMGTAKSSPCKGQADRLKNNTSQRPIQSNCVWNCETMCLKSHPSARVINKRVCFQLQIYEVGILNLMMGCNTRGIAYPLRTIHKIVLNDARPKPNKVVTISKTYI